MPIYAYPHAGERRATLSEAQRKVVDLLICNQVDTLTTEVRDLTRRHESSQFAIERLADRTQELETDVQRILAAGSGTEDISIHTQHLVISEDEGEDPLTRGGAMHTPDPWFFWLNDSETSDSAKDHAIVRNLMVLEDHHCGARGSQQEPTASTCFGTSGSQLLDLRSDHTGDEYSTEYDELALADNHRDANASTSSSVSVHRPEAAGPIRGTTYYSSTYLSDDKFESITSIETKCFHDAGDMRGEVEGNCSYVNLYLTETSAASEDEDFQR